MKKKIDFLNFEFSSGSSRDSEPSILITNLLRMLGFTVIRGSIFESKSLVLKHKPKCVFMSGPHGSQLKFELALLCRKLEIPLITYPGEGSMHKFNSSIESIWGHNWLRHPVHTRWGLWNLESLKIMEDFAPSLAQISEVTGYAGADFPIIHQPLELDLISKTSFSKIVGVGCSNFEFCHPDSPNRSYLEQQYGKLYIQRFIEDRDHFNSMIVACVKQYTDVLFLIRLHPGAKHSTWASGVEGIKGFPNVRFVDKAPLFETLRSVKLWISYNSITALESYLIGTPSLFFSSRKDVNPWSDPHLHGVPRVVSLDELYSYFDTFVFSGDSESDFLKLKSLQKPYIEGLFGEFDGLNHVRFVKLILQTIEKDKDALIFSPLTRRDRINALLSKFLAYRDLRHWRWKLYGDQQLSKKIAESQLKFYAIHKEKILGILGKDFSELF